MNEDGQMEDSTEAEETPQVRQSRWVAKSNVPRYDKRTLDGFNRYVEEPGWHRGAKVSKR